MTVPLVTSYWRAVLADARGSNQRPAYTPVAASVGLPRGVRWANAMRCSEITPWGLVSAKAKELTADEWRERYVARLERHGVEKIQQRFETLYREYGKHPLALLCWEENPADCHRSYFADWWAARTSQVVPEAIGLDRQSLMLSLSGALF